jgi:adenosylhomocysteine nucleosidase
MVLPSLKARLVAFLFAVVFALTVHADPAGPILFAAATDAELQPLIAKLDAPVTESRAAWQFWLGSINGKKVVLTRTEGDPLNAVAATTLAIRRYHPKLVVTYGLARAHDPALQPGDVVVSEKFATFEGMVSDVTPLDGGSAPLAWHRLPQLLATTGEKETPTYFFAADASALAVAKTVTAARGRVVVGVPGSAHQLNREVDRIAWIRAQWGTSSEDGESAHIAGCAQLLGVPAIGLRVIDGTEDEAVAMALKFLEASK